MLVNACPLFSSASQSLKNLERCLESVRIIYKPVWDECKLATVGMSWSMVKFGLRASSRMQTSAFGRSKGLRAMLTEGSWSEVFDGLGISLLLTSNPAIQYTVFNQLKQNLLDRKLKKAGNGSSPESLSAFSAFLLGAISKSARS